MHGMSAVYIINRIGPRTDPCGTPCTTIVAGAVIPAYITDTTRFNDTSSESDFQGFVPAEVEASMMPTVGARVDSSEDEMGENKNEGEGEPAMDESDSDIDQAPADGLDADGGVRSKKYGGDGIRPHLLP